MHFFFNFFQRGMNVKRGCLKTFETPSHPAYFVEQMVVEAFLNVLWYGMMVL